MVGRAAALGAEMACSNLGMWHRDGIHGFPKDESQVRKWFRKMETCSLKWQKGSEMAAKWLREHPKNCACPATSSHTPHPRADAQPLFPWHIPYAIEARRRRRRRRRRQRRLRKGAQEWA